MVAINSDIQGYKEAERLLGDGIEIITSGFPCQDISTAGHRSGIQYDKTTGEARNRSGLFGEAVRTVRLVRPLYWIMENVAAIYDRELGVVFGAVAESGYDAQWDCLSSGRLGRRHLRERFYAVAYPHGQRQQGSEFRMPQDTGERNLHAALFSAFPLRPPIHENELPQPFVVGKNDGIPDRAHRIRALGNSADPELIETIGQGIKYNDR